MNLPRKTDSLWLATDVADISTPIVGDITVDVAIVGAGITGITAAALLEREGKSVALVDKAHVGSGETGHTTAHLTEALDGRYTDLISKFGEEGARLAAESTRTAIDHIASVVRQHRISCGFRRVPGYFYSESPEERERLDEEGQAARRAGLRAELTSEVPLPFRVPWAVRFPDQAEFHPQQYLRALAGTLRNSRVFEGTQVIDVEDGEPCYLRTNTGTVTARDVIVAANVPINNRVFLHTKIAAYRSYVVAAPISEALAGLFWDTDDPYHYTRSQEAEGRTFLIVGGEDHKVGLERDTEEAYQRLEEFVRTRFPVRSLAYRWSGQIIEPVDGLPFIGLNSLSHHVYVATGYSGNGITFGTLAGMILADVIAGRENTYADLYDATRVKLLASAKEYISENVDFPKHLVADRLTNLNVETTALAEVARNEGKIVALDGEKYAVYRDSHGKVCALSPVCPHLGCDVRWNTAEKSWDCPCHGSRFSAEGKVVNGPAVTDLAAKVLPQEDQ